MKMRSPGFALMTKLYMAYWECEVGGYQRGYWLQGVWEYVERWVSSALLTHLDISSVENYSIRSRKRRVNEPS